MAFQDLTEELKKQIKLKEIRSVYTFYGEEEYLKQFYCGLLQKAVVGDGDETFGAVSFDENDFQIDAFLDEVLNVSFAAEKKLIILRNIDLDAMSDGDAGALVEALKSEDSQNCVLLYYDGMFLTDCKYDKANRRKKMIDGQKKYSYVVEFRHPTVNMLINWIRKNFAALGVNVQYDATKYLLTVCGSDMNNLKNEIVKLSIYAPDGSITKETVDTVVTRSLENNVFTIADDVIGGRIRAALATISDCRAAKESPEGILRIIQNTFWEMLILCAAKEKGMTKAEKAKALALGQNREWLLDRYERAVSGKSTDYFCKAFIALAECENKLKGSGCDKWQALEMTLISTAALK